MNRYYLDLFLQAKSNNTKRSLANFLQNKSESSDVEFVGESVSPHANELMTFRYLLDFPFSTQVKVLPFDINNGITVLVKEL